eukprot:m.164893 g.164893  ORF g.164893 m.164893 type:complete len:568 (-) comp31360_c1_seq1:31-1734(-)
MNCSKRLDRNSPSYSPYIIDMRQRHINDNVTRFVVAVFICADVPLVWSERACPGVMLNDTNFDVVADVGTCAATSVDSCCSCCIASEYCTGFTFYQGVCYLKDDTSSASNCTGCTSARIPGNRFSSSCKLLPQVDIKPDGTNGTIASLQVGSTAECCGACEQNFMCVAWTMLKGTCYLKETNLGTQPCADCTSGIIASRATPSLPSKWEMAGMTFTGGRYCPNVTMGSQASFESMKHLKSTGATWVSLVVTQYQWNISSTEIFPLYNGSVVYDTTSHYYEFVTITNDELRQAVAQARTLGLKIMLKPHVDLLRDNKPLGRFWRGDIGGCPAKDWSPPPVGVTPFTKEQWTQWFSSYSDFFLPYAALAEELNIEMVSMNCELYCPNKQQQFWRDLVHKTRNIYYGTITTSQIAGHEEELQWWDVVDVIGIDAYYRVAGNTVAEMVESWKTPKALAKKLHLQYNKPIAYTELGFCSGKCSRTHQSDVADYNLHALKYVAVFEAFGNSSWFLGVFWWNWNTDPGAFGMDDCLTPQFKPAEDVLRLYYRSNTTKPEPHGVAQCIGPGKCTC